MHKCDYIWFVKVLIAFMYFMFVCFFFLVSPATTVPGQADSASIKSPALPTQQAVTPVQAGTTALATTAAPAPASASPQSQLPHQTQAHMPTQSPTSLQVKTQGGTAQLKLQQSPQIISMSGLQQQVQVWPLITCYWSHKCTETNTGHVNNIMKGMHLIDVYK